MTPADRLRQLATEDEPIVLSRSERSACLYGAKAIELVTIWAKVDPSPLGSSEAKDVLAYLAKQARALVTEAER